MKQEHYCNRCNQYCREKHQIKLNGTVQSVCYGCKLMIQMEIRYIAAIEGKGGDTGAGR